MAATAVLALVPAFLLALFGQKYVIRGLRIKKTTTQRRKRYDKTRRRALATSSPLPACWPPATPAPGGQGLRIDYEPARSRTPRSP